MTFFIAPPAATAWTFSQEELIASIEDAWTSTEDDYKVAIEQHGVRAGRVVAVLAGENGAFEVAQNKAHPNQILDLDGAMADVCRFAAWWRSQVAETQQLIFFDVSFSVVEELTQDIDADDIAAKAATAT